MSFSDPPNRATYAPLTRSKYHAVLASPTTARVLVPLTEMSRGAWAATHPVPSAWPAAYPAAFDHVRVWPHGSPPPADPRSAAASRTDPSAYRTGAAVNGFRALVPVPAAAPITVVGNGHVDAVDGSRAGGAGSNAVTVAVQVWSP